MSVSAVNSIPRIWRDSLADTGRVSLGLDLASTKNKRSNPSALAVMQKVGHLYNTPLEARWKTDDTDVFLSILSHVIKDIPPTQRGCLVIDSSNDKLAAMSFKRRLSHLIRVVLVAGNDVIRYKGEEFMAKVLLGSLLCNLYEDRIIAIPNAPWLVDDHRLVSRDGASFSAVVDVNGCHADNFDAEKLAHWGLVGIGARTEASAIDTRTRAGNSGDGITPTRLERMASLYHSKHNF